MPSCQIVGQTIPSWPDIALTMKSMNKVIMLTNIYTMRKLNANTEHLYYKRVVNTDLPTGGWVMLWGILMGMGS